jgi:hypothetical protein
MANKAQRIGFRNLGKSSSKSNSVPAPTGASMSTDKNDYMAEDDARTIARAHAIKSNPERLAAAAKVAHRMAEEKSGELRGLRSIARKAKG